MNSTDSNEGLSCQIQWLTFFPYLISQKIWKKQASISLKYFILKIHRYHVLTVFLLPHGLLFSSLLFINSLSFAQIRKAENSISWNFSQVVIFPDLIQSKGFKGPLHAQSSYTFISVPNSPYLHTDFFIQLPVQHHSLMGNMHVKINISKAKLLFFFL